MTDNNTQQNNMQVNMPLFSGALGKFETSLRNAGMDEQSIGFFAGKMVRKAMEMTAEDVYNIIGEERFANLEKIEDAEEKNKQIEAILIDKYSLNLSDYQEKLMEKLLAEFEGKK
jgi:hypothetical protein